MPWKGITDPYRIWLSEIILQQTRVEQGMGYYQRFITAFPDIESLARAPDAKVFKLWEGLGYYSRCRNLIITAKIISKEYGGKFPADYNSILALKGIGPYTAAAISSFAFDLPHAVLDGNVFRVLARIFGVSAATDTTEGKKIFTLLANDLLDRNKPGVYNQAIMDFGAMICKPVRPLCDQCVFKNDCIAFLTNRISELPVKIKKINIRKRWFNYVIMHHNGMVAIRQRTDKDIWQDLWEFPLVETTSNIETSQVLEEAELKYGIPKDKYTVDGTINQGRQQLSHQLINGQFMNIYLQHKPDAGNKWKWIPADELERETFPVLINNYLESVKGSLSIPNPFQL